MLEREAYLSALMELDAELSGEDLKQKFAALEIEEELQALKAKYGNKPLSLLQPAPSTASKRSLTPSVIPSETSASQVSPSKRQSAAPDIEAEVVSLKTQPSETWRCVHTLKGHSATVNSIAISADGQTIASGSDDRTASLWNLKTGKRICTFFGCSKGVFSVALSPDGQMVVSGDLDRTITSWKLDTKAMRSFYSHSGSPYSHSGYVYSVAFSPDGQTLASGSADKTIKIWNLRRWVSTRTLTGHSDTVWSVAISPDSQTLASGSADRTIRLWHLSSWEQPRILTGHSGWVNSVAFSPDGQSLASGSGDATIKLWNLHTGELLRTINGHSAAVLSVALSPDGQTLASSSRDGTIKLWNLRTGELLFTLSGRGSVAFSPDGNTLVSGGNGGTIKIWRQMLGGDESIVDPVLSGEWWEVLGVDKDTHPDDVKRSYRRLARHYHPDVNRSASAKATMQALNGAYQEFRQKLSTGWL